MNLTAAGTDPRFDRGDFRGLGDQASAAKRSYSARAALRFLLLPLRLSEPGFASIKLNSPNRASRERSRTVRSRHFLSSACGRDQALADRPRRADPSGPQFQLRGRGRRLVVNGVDGPTRNDLAVASPVSSESYAQQFSELNAMLVGDAIPARHMVFRDGRHGCADRELTMTVHAPKLLTPEEFASLIEIAIASDNPTVPPPHLSKLLSLGYVLETAKGLVVTGDGLVRITESE